MSCSITVPFIHLRQGLSENLEPGWRPVCPVTPLSSPAMALMLQAQGRGRAQLFT